MNRIKSIYELRGLKPGEMFYHIQRGNFTSYTVVGEHPKIQGVVAVNNSNFHDAACFFGGVTGNFSHDSVILTGEYDSVEIGEWMQDQLMQQIEAIEKYYIIQ